MKRIVLTVIVTLIVILVAEAAGLLTFIKSGAYNVSTLRPEHGAIDWALATGMTGSVARHAKNIQAPALGAPAMVQEGFKHYQQMCVACHGAPGKPPDEIAMGLWPEAPNLARSSARWTAGQLFWITKNGIKFTAMPAWGPTHSDDKLWAIVAFVQKLPQISPADYHEMEQNLPAPQGQKTEATAQESQARAQ